MIEYIAVDALERYDELRTTGGVVTTIVVESLPGGAPYRPARTRLGCAVRALWGSSTVTVCNRSTL